MQIVSHLLHPEWWRIECQVQYLSLANWMLEAIHLVQPQGWCRWTTLKKNTLTSRMTEHLENKSDDILWLKNTVWSCMVNHAFHKLFFNVWVDICFHFWSCLELIYCDLMIRFVLVQACYSEVHKACRPWPGHFAKSSAKSKVHKTTNIKFIIVSNPGSQAMFSKWKPRQC